VRPNARREQGPPDLRASAGRSRLFDPRLGAGATLLPTLLRPRRSSAYAPRFRYDALRVIAISGDASMEGRMNARLERKLRMLAVIIAVGTVAGLAVNFAQGRTSPS
jgi:hypothetical protein